MSESRESAPPISREHAERLRSQLSSIEHLAADLRLELQDAGVGPPPLHGSGETDHAAVWICPGRLSGQPAIAGHRLSCALIGDYAQAMPVAEICRMYSLTRGDVLVACWYLATLGGRGWRKRWGAWVAEYAGPFWHGDYAAIPDPPRTGAA